MKVKELINKLELLDPELEVMHDNYIRHSGTYLFKISDVEAITFEEMSKRDPDFVASYFDGKIALMNTNLR